jgi:hypothetical protein
MRRVIGAGATATARATGVLAVAAAAIVLAALPAAAHTEWQPNTAAPGSVIALTLFAEDEQPDAGTVSVELQFPQPLTIVELGAVDGFTATPVGGGVGAGTTATGVTWTGGPAPGDLNLPITLGPLPAQEGRLQFKAVQTYDNGEVERWIDDFPAGAPEPDHPGPVLDLVAGGPGTIPATTAPATTAAPTTEAQTTTSEDLDATVTIESDEAQGEAEDDDSNALPWVLGALLLSALVIGGVVLYLRSRNQQPPSDPGAPPPPAEPPTGEAA